MAKPLFSQTKISGTLWIAEVESLVRVAFRPEPSP